MNTEDRRINTQDQEHSTEKNAPKLVKISAKDSDGVKDSGRYDG